MKNLAEINDWLEHLDMRIDESAKRLDRCQTNYDVKQNRYEAMWEAKNYEAKCEGMSDSKAKAWATMETQEEKRQSLIADAKFRKAKRIFYQVMREKETLVVQGNNIRKEMKLL